MQGGDLFVDALQTCLQRGSPGHRHHVGLVLGRRCAELLAQIAAVALRRQQQFLDLFAVLGSGDLAPFRA